MIIIKYTLRYWSAKPSPITRANRSIKTCCWASYGERYSDLFRICFNDAFRARMVRVYFISPFQFIDFFINPTTCLPSCAAMKGSYGTILEHPYRDTNHQKTNDSFTKSKTAHGYWNIAISIIVQTKQKGENRRQIAAHHYRQFRPGVITFRTSYDPPRDTTDHDGLSVSVACG